MTSSNAKIRIDFVLNLKTFQLNVMIDNLQQGLRASQDYGIHHFLTCA
jgi:hypothetical protein